MSTILEQCLLGVHRKCEYLAAAARGRTRISRRDGALLVGQRRPIEDLGDALPLFDFHQKSAPPISGKR